MGASFSSPGIISGWYFRPATIQVVIGVNNTIRRTNNDTNADHTVTSYKGLFNSGNMLTGSSFTCTFVTAGTYYYYCIYHPEMVGTVVVKAP
jgi:plastocyanin